MLRQRCRSMSSSGTPSRVILSGIHQEQAQEQVGDGGLAGAGFADQRGDASRGYLQRDLLQHRLAP